jgi:hypothetical protein
MGEVVMSVRRVVVLTFALTASGVGPSDGLPFAAAQLPASARPYIEAATLVANVENAVRTIVPADQMSGASQILDLVGQTNFEEQWAFVPAINLWIEIGTNESASELDSQVEVDTDYLKQIVALYHAVEIVHFHPAGYYRRVWQHESYRIEFSADALESGDLQPIGFALPSPTDVVSSIDLSRMLLAHDPAASITYSVVSPHGVVTYGPTAPGLRTIVYDWGNPRAWTARSIVTRIAIRRMTFNIASTINALRTPTIGDVIEALCAQATDDNYRLSFRPF